MTCSDKFSKVIKIEPYNRKYYNLHAATYLRLGEYEKARQDAGKAIDISRDVRVGVCGVRLVFGWGIQVSFT